MIYRGKEVEQFTVNDLDKAALDKKVEQSSTGRNVLDIDRSTHRDGGVSRYFATIILEKKSTLLVEG